MRIIGCDLHSRQQTLAHRNRGSSKSDSHARRQQRAGFLFHASRSSARKNRNGRVIEVVFAPDGRAGNRVSGQLGVFVKGHRC
jgi:hypothetical protein